MANAAVGPERSATGAAPTSEGLALVGASFRNTVFIVGISYNNNSHESPANNGGSTIVAGKTVAGTDLAGRCKVNSVRAVGDTLALSHEDDHGTFKAGFWFDYQHGPRYQIALDYNVANAQTPGMVATPSGYLDPLAPATKGGYVYNMHFFTRTREPMSSMRGARCKT